jgi:hypothetical protein
MTTERYRKYAAYMKSKEWAIRRNRYFDSHKKQCRACGSSKLIQLHHKTYARLGAERDQDLVALCSKCHRSLHLFHRKGDISLWRATEVFIRKKRSRSSGSARNKKSNVGRRRKINR